MSILLETNSGWIISHEKYFDRLKVKVPSLLCSSDNHPSHVDVNGEEVLDSSESKQRFQYFRINPSLFEIKHPFRELKSGKPNEGMSKFTETTKLVKQLGDEILSHPEAKTIFINGDVQVNDKDNDMESNGCFGKWPKNNRQAVEASQRFFDTVKDIKWPQLHGHNPDKETSVISQVDGCSSESLGGSEETHRFIFPPGSTFYCNDVVEMASIFQSEAAEEKFDLIVIDPPWWNKFIRRKKRKQHEAGYEMLNNSGIAALPIKSILKDDGMVVLWCTNAKSNQDAVLNEIFPAWGVHFCKMLHWLKVTNSGVPVCPFNVENKKQPYEAIVIGVRGSPSLIKSSSAETEPRILVSVPSSINSHKPPLIEVLKRLYPHRNFQKKLEVFARYLTPEFTSFGNEVIKLQHMSLFEEVA